VNDTNAEFMLSKKTQKEGTIEKKRSILMKYYHQTWQIPEETKRIAKAAFPKGTPFMTMRDEIGVIYKNSEFADLFDHRGKAAESPGNLVMVMVMQYAEGLTDAQAAEAVRGRIDWKYALALPMTDSGFSESTLSRFRQRLITGGMEMKLLDHMLAHFSERGWIETKEQRTDSTHVLAAVKRLSRLEVVGEAMRFALSALAVVAPAWLKEQITDDWFELYGPRFGGYRLPQTEAKQKQLRMRIGQDGYDLLATIYENAPQEMPLQHIPAVQILRQIWLQQYYQHEGILCWRQADNLPPAAKLIESPYDIDAHYSRKRETKWVGYKVHVTETCTPNTPHLITHVVTTPATRPDEDVTQEIHQALVEKGLPPETHYVDAGYVDAENLTQSSQQQIDLLGPASVDTSWQARDPAAFDHTRFAINWEQKTVMCPQGHQSRTWSESQDAYANEVIHVAFDRQTCHDCGNRTQCTTSKSGRRLKLRGQEQHIALQLARQRQSEADFKERYRRRAGVEGTISQGVRSFHLRTCRYRGVEKGHLQHILIAAAMNVTRMVYWLRGDKHARTRITPFSALALTFT
jgi:transposase